MSQPTVLNLDEFRVTRTVVINGKERVLKNMTVEQFMAADDIEKKLASAETPKDQAKILVEVISEFLEDTPISDIMKLDMGQLLILLAFIRGSDISDKVKGGTAEAGQPGEAKAGKRKGRSAS